MACPVYRYLRTRLGWKRPHRTWGYPVIPVACLVASVAMILYTLLAESGLTLLSFGLRLLGAPVYYLTVGKGNSSHASGVLGS